MASSLLEDVGSFLRRFVVMTETQLDAVALWVAHTHAVEAAEVTPYLVVTSAEKRSGKTRLREALELVVHVPLPAANISDAALFRAIASLTPTLLLDEADAVFRAREREDLRGLLNAGYRRGAVAYRMGGANRSTLESFPVFCAKGFFGIGDFLPDTLADRAIPIRLQRRCATSRWIGSAGVRSSRRDIGCVTGLPTGYSRSWSTSIRQGPRCRRSWMTGQPIPGSRCSRSPISLAVTGRQGPVRRPCRCLLGTSARTTP
jgi:hypothetical protein